MENSIDLPPTGPFEARYVAFLETITQLRPPLHRYCARMTGSVMDGEDVVQSSNWPLGCFTMPGRCGRDLGN